MIFADSLVRELLRGGWLEWTDIIRLQTYSSRIVRDSIIDFLQSNDFKTIYEESFCDVFTCDSGKRDKPSSQFRLLTRLNWVKTKKVNVDECLAHFEASHFAALEAQQGVEHYDFIKTAVIAYDDVVSFTQLVAVLLDAFPKLRRLMLIGKEVPRDLLRSLLIASSTLPLRSLRFDMDAKMQFSSEQTSLLCKIIAKLPQLEEFLVPPNWQIPQEVCDALWTHCKALKRFPLDNRSLIASTVTALVLRAHGLCPSLTELSITHCKVDIDDKDMYAICQGLPGLENVSVRYSDMTLQSIATALQLCRNISLCAIQGLLWKKSTITTATSAKDDDANRTGCESLLAFQGVHESLLKPPALSNLLSLVPHPLALSLEERVDFLVCTHLQAALATGGHGNKVREVCVSIDSLESLEHLVGLFGLIASALQCLVLRDRQHTLVSRSVMDYVVNMLCMHCNQVHTLKLEGIADFQDAHLAQCVEGLAGLHTIFLEGSMRSITSQGLSSLASAGRTWRQLRVWGTSIGVADIVRCMEQEDLRVLLLDFQEHGCMCSVGYGKVLVRVVDVIRAIL